MKLLLDVNLPRALAGDLVARGHDARRVTDFLPADALDEEILELAANEEAVVITRDQDFSFLASRPGRTRPSVVNLRIDAVDRTELAAAIDFACRKHGTQLESGAILSVTHRGVRIRLLPVS